MDSSDTFKTVNKTSRGLFKDRGSRFISFLFPVTEESEIKAHLENLKKEYHDARHHCYAYVLGKDGDRWRINDDGEPSGTAGRPVLGQIKSNGLTNVLIVVVRYFGGTLLGVKGLTNAYKLAAADAIANAEIVNHIVYETYRISFPYAALNDVMKILKDEKIKQMDRSFDTECSVVISLRKSSSRRIMNRFSLIEGFISSMISVF